jgi:hypothetical protein
LIFPNPAERRLVRSEEAYAEAVKSVPKVDDVRERRRLQNKLARAGKSLHRWSAADAARVSTAFS